MTTCNIRFDKMDDSFVKELQPSFDQLRETDHKDGKFRLRKYALVEINRLVHALGYEKDFSYNQLDVDTFNQSSRYNKHQGDIDRKFQTISEDVLYSDAMGRALDNFSRIGGLQLGDTIHIHQMRVITSSDEAQVSPEGVHQDGYEFVGFVGINRHNVKGGELMLCHQQDEQPFLKLPMPNGTMITIKDDELWHNGSPIRPKHSDSNGYLDLFVLTASEV